MCVCVNVERGAQAWVAEENGACRCVLPRTAAWERLELPAMGTHLPAEATHYQEEEEGRGARTRPHSRRPATRHDDDDDSPLRAVIPSVSWFQAHFEY